MNPYLAKRLDGLQRELMAKHDGVGLAASASKGSSREAVVKSLIEAALPPPFRCGSGEITDVFGNLIGQLDIVVEYPHFPRLAGGPSSLYIAEGVACVIEVKSDLAGQWREVEETVAKVKSISHAKIRGGSGSNGIASWFGVPVLAVGFRGRKRPSSMATRLCPTLRGMFVIEHGLYVGGVGDELEARPPELSGPAAIWGFMCALSAAATSISSLDFDPMLYDSVLAHGSHGPIVGWVGRNFGASRSEHPWAAEPHFRHLDSERWSAVGSRDDVSEALRDRHRKLNAAGVWPAGSK